MNPRYPVFALMLAAAVLTAGCTGAQYPVEKQAPGTSVPASVTQALPTTGATPVPAICPVPATGSYWISIDPVKNVSSGETIVVTGATNIPAGMALNITISHYQFRALPHYRPPSVSDTVAVRKTGACNNSFSYSFGSSEYLGAGKTDAEVYSPDERLNGHNYPANISTFFIIAR